MPLQNRVGPDGRIFRSPARGTFMGNRGGALHNEQREIVRQHKSRQWIACVLEFKDRHREVMSPRRYTELFFLDEAVAFAAGHRPCAECRRARFLAFKEAWARRSGADPRAVRAPQIDRELHAARVDAHRNKVTFRSKLGELPDGTFVRIDDGAYLVHGDSLLLWTPEGYGAKQARAAGLTVAVLTPRPIVECFRHGYLPEIHVSAER